MVSLYRGVPLVLGIWGIVRIVDSMKIVFNVTIVVPSDKDILIDNQTTMFVNFVCYFNFDII